MKTKIVKIAGNTLFTLALLIGFFICLKFNSPHSTGEGGLWKFFAICVYLFIFILSTITLMINELVVKKHKARTNIATFLICYIPVILLQLFFFANLRVEETEINSWMISNIGVALLIIPSFCFYSLKMADWEWEDNSKTEDQL